MVILALGGGLSLILYTHGTWWWYAPLAGAGVVLSHIALLGGIVFAAMRATRGRCTYGGATARPPSPRHSRHDESMLLHRPRLFDWMAWVHTLGQETKLRQWTLDLADLQPGHVLLDVGCGTGTLLLAAAQRVGPSGAVHGIEPSPEMAAYARRKAEASRMPLQVVAGSAGSLPYPPDAFDAVFCTLVLHHLPASMREDAIREMRRVLRPGGWVVLVDWQRPQSLVRAIVSPMFPVYLLHNLGSKGSPLDVLPIERLMTHLGFSGITRHAFGGGGVGAVVGRLASGARAIAQAEPQDVTRVRSDA
jgi:ubiquinone/menaquinone biosynthesis C-methylase UbiE